MHVYSKRIFRFIEEIKSIVKDVLSKEIGLKVTQDRFYDRSQRSTYPIHVVIFNNKVFLGYFNSGFYELGFNECLMRVDKVQLRNIIRHELAHYMTFINYGMTSSPHSVEFRELCKRFGWGEEVYLASATIQETESCSEIEESAVLRKVQKLMALGTSSNKHEAELAMIKSQQLLLKHNIDASYVGEEDDEKIFLIRILKQKKETAKMRAIATILRTFFVNTVFSRDGEYTYLEILGNAVNIEIAEYVATILEVEMDKLWIYAKAHSFVKGMIAKNSFFHGIAIGYTEKIKALKVDYNDEYKCALMVIENKLENEKSMVYKRLASSRSQGYFCSSSSQLGQQAGKSLNINPALKGSSKQSMALLG